MNVKLWIVSVLTTASVAGEFVEPKVAYDNIVLGFDELCQDGGKQTLIDYIRDQSRFRRSAANLKGLMNIEGVAIQHLEKVVKEVVEKNVDKAQREDAARRTARRIARESKPVTARTLANTPTGQREDEILGMLHLMAALDIAQGNTSIVESVAITRAQNVTEPRSLEYIEGLKVVRNPVLGYTLLNYASLLPCLKFAPQANRVFTLPGPEELQRIDKVQPRSADDDIVVDNAWWLWIDVLDEATMQARLDEEKLTGRVSLKRRTGGPKVYMRQPLDDTSAWPYQIFTYDGPTTFWGAGLDSAWMMLALDVLYKEDPSLKQKSQILLTYEQVINAIKRGYGAPVIGVVDSGCSRHPDLMPNFWRNPKMAGCTGDAVVGTGGDDGSGYSNACIGFDTGLWKADPTTIITDNHGTAVGGMVVAQGDNGVGAMGGCPWCKLMCLKAHDGAQMSDAIILDAVNFAIAYGANITNHSYGLYSNNPIYEAMHDALTAAGIFQTSSAGNSACDMDSASVFGCTQGGTKPHIPSAYCMTNKAIMSIGNSGYDSQKADRSNWGAKSTSVFAPGYFVGLLNGEDGAYIQSGTSFSAPLVASMAGILKTKYPELKHFEITDIIKESAMPVPGLKGMAQAEGIADAHRALAYAGLYLKNKKN